MLDYNEKLKPKAIESSKWDYLLGVDINSAIIV